MTNLIRKGQPIAICAFYKFVSLKNCKRLQHLVLSALKDNNIRGTILLAEEGINGTIAGPHAGINNYLTWIQAKKNFKDLSYKLSYDAHQPFLRTKVKLKKEIVTMGKKAIDPKKIVGTYVKPKDWNRLISDPDVLLIDTRNDYEVEIGTFRNSINPKTKTFREFPSYVEQKLASSKQRKIATFCTGGIRCEKATAYLKQKGFKEVYHLEGGILKYLEKIPKKNSLWKGECFVFDNRVAVDHYLNKGSYDQCHACRYPIAEKDKKKKTYVKGVSCPRCVKKTSKKKKEALRERQFQVKLALKRGEHHIGSEAAEALYHRKKIKKLRWESL